MLLSDYRTVLECIDTTLNRMPNKLIRCIPTKQKRKINQSRISFSTIMFSTYAHVANKFFVADCFIGFIDGWWTLRAQTIAGTRISTAIIVSTRISAFQYTSIWATRTLQQIYRICQFGRQIINLCMVLESMKTSRNLIEFNYTTVEY